MTEMTDKKTKASWVKPPTTARQVTWNITAQPRAHPRANLIYLFIYLFIYTMLIEGSAIS